MKPHPTLIVTALLAAALPARAASVRIDADEAVRRALEASHTAAAADARLAAATAQVRSADAAALPTVSAAVSAVRRSSVPEFRLPATAGVPVTLFPDITDLYSGALTARQTLYAGGAVAGARAAARADQDATGAERERTASAVRLAARLAYWRAVTASAAISVANAQVERAEGLEADARALREAGMAVNAEVLATQARTEAARLRRIRAEQEATLARAALLSLLALPPDAELELADADVPTMPGPPAPLDELLATARAQRPELAAARARLLAIQARERVASAATRPAVSLQASWELANPNPRHLPQRDEWNDSWSVGLGAGWTLFDGGRAAAEAASVRAQAAALAAETAELERAIALDVESAARSLQSALAADAAARAGLDAARARIAAAFERRGAGLATATELLDAQADLADAEREAIVTRAGARAAAAELERAVGR